MGVGGEDVEDDRGAIDHRHAERRLQVALLARRELVVAGDEVGVDGGDLRLDLVELAGAEVGVGVRLVATLDHRSHRGDARRAQQLLQLGEMVVLARRYRRDHQSAAGGPGHAGAGPPGATRDFRYRWLCSRPTS